MNGAAGMAFFAPTTIAQVLRLLADPKGYRCLAGGGLVVPALRGGNHPTGLISLKRIPGLRGIVLRRGKVRIGAMATHADIMQAEMLAGGLSAIRRAAAQIANPVIRRMTTIGGTLCRADPGADYFPALLAAGALIHLRSRDAERAILLEDFILADGDTVRRPDELLLGVSVSVRPVLGGGGYARFARVVGDYPIASAAVRLDWSGPAVVGARIAVGGCGPLPYLVPQATLLLAGARQLDDVPDALVSAAVQAARPRSDIGGTAEYRRMLIPGLLRGALAQAFAEAGG
jgi:carbon-monoxide dehydrogenase medium subunit